MAETLTVTIVGKDGVSQTFRAIAREADTLGDAVEKAGQEGEKGFRRIGDSADKTKMSVNDLGAAMTALGSALAYAGNAALDQQQTIIGLEAAFGDAADEMIRFADEMASVTIFNDDDIMRGERYFATLRNNYDLSLDQIQQLMQTTADLASAYGTTFEDASSRVTAAIRGEGEAAEYLGLTMNQQSIDRENLTLTMTNQEAAQFRLNALYEQAGVYQGTALRLTETEVGTRARLTNAVQDNAQALGDFIGPIGTMVGGVGLAVTGLTSMTGTLTRLASTARTSRVGLAALGMATNPVALGLGALAGAGVLAWNIFQEGEERSQRLEGALLSLGDVAENLRLSHLDEQAQIVEDFARQIEDVQTRSAAFADDFDLAWAEAGRIASETGEDIEDVYARLLDAYTLNTDGAERFAAAQDKIGSAFADNRVNHDALDAALDELHKQYLLGELTLDGYAEAVIDVSTRLDDFRLAMDGATTSTTGLAAALRLIRPEVQGLVTDFLAFNEIGEDDSFGERFMKTLGLDLATLSEVEVRTGRLLGNWRDLGEMPAPDASQEDWMAWVNQAERGTIEWQRRVEAANEARQAESRAAIDTAAALDVANAAIGGAVAGLNEMARAWDDVGGAASTSLDAINARVRQDFTEHQRLTDEFIGGMLEIGNIDLAAEVNLAGLGTDATFAAQEINQVGAALDSVLGVYDQIDALGSRMRAAGGIADALFGDGGDPSDGVGPLRDVYDAGLIGQEQFNAAIEDGIQIQQAAAESQLYLNKMRADQLPILNDTTQAYLEQIQAISELGAEEQMVALGWMDSGMQDRVQQFMDLTAEMNNFGAEGEAAMQQVIDGIVATDPVLTAMLDDLGLIEQQLDGSYTLSLDAEGAVSDIERLTASIDALTVALGGTPPSYDINVTGIDQVEGAKALIDAMDDHEINVTFGTSGLEQGKQALRDALGVVGGGDDGGVTVPVNLQVPTDLPPLPQPDPLEIPVTFYNPAAGAIGEGASWAAEMLGGGVESGLSIEYSITADDQATPVLNNVRSAAEAIPDSETITITEVGAGAVIGNLHAIRNAADAIPEAESITLGTIGAEATIGNLHAVANAANAIPTEVTTTIRTIRLGEDNNVLPGGRHGGIPGYAHGGVLFEGGEAGPELAYFAGGGVALLPTHGIYSAPPNTYVSPANAVGAVGAPSINVTVHVAGSVQTEIGIAETVSRHLSPIIADVFEERYRGHGM